MKNIYLIFITLVMTTMLLVVGCGSSTTTTTTKPVELSNTKAYTVDEINSELKRILVNSENKDKACVAYKIRDVKKVGENEFTVMIYSDLGDGTNFSGNTYQILEYINANFTSKTKVQFFQIAVQYFKKIDGESIRVYTYEIPKEAIKPILDYGSKEGSPLTELKKPDKVTKEKDLDKLFI